MRLGYLTNQYPKVSHTFVRREIVALEALGWQVHRFSVRKPLANLPDPRDREEAAKTEVLLSRGLLWDVLRALPRLASHPLHLLRTAFALWRAYRQSDRGLVAHVAYFFEACRLLVRAADLGIEHVHVHFGTNPATVAWLGRLLGGPTFSMTVHGPEEFDRAPCIALADKLLAARFTLAVSDYGRSQLLRLLPASKWAKVQVVRCGLDAEVLDAPTTPVLDSRQLVCVARLSEQKGHLSLLEAAAELAAEAEFELVLVGDGELRSEIEARARVLGLEGRVRITGYVDQETVLEHLRAARALVLPSFGEGLPVVIMEALALERPVVSTYIAGIPELVRPGKSGWLVPASATAELRDALREVLAMPVERLHEMGRRGRQDVLSFHDIRESARRIDALLRQPPAA